MKAFIHVAIASSSKTFVLDWTEKWLHQFVLLYRTVDRLSELTGLTTGSVTRIIDRLEKAGYVRRTNDPKDRRRTIIESTKNKKLERKIEIIFMHLHERMHKLMSSYSDSQLSFLLDSTTEVLIRLIILCLVSYSPIFKYCRRRRVI